MQDTPTSKNTTPELAAEPPASASEVAEAAGRPARLRRRRWPWITVAIAGGLAIIVAAGTAVFQAGLPWWSGEGDHTHTYRSEAGALRYQVHVPPQHDGATPLPVIVAIHGCGMTGYGVNSMKASTQFNELADREGFIVVYPTQRLFRNALNCWDSGDPREQFRYAGEPALIAGLTQEVLQEYGGDPDRVHVTGASSGAGTAVILAATYPDVFASASSIAGGEYGLNQVDPDDPDATPPAYTARQAWAQMGERARLVPMLVVQGEEDEVVPPLVGERLVEQWLAIADLVDDGLLNDSLDLDRDVIESPATDELYAYTHLTFRTPEGVSVVEKYLVHGMGHSWSGPAGVGLFTDHAGPDAAVLVWEFTRDHPRPSPPG